MDDVNAKIEKAVRDASHDGRISCSLARGIAAELDVPVGDVGDVADSLGIKIYGCELGCF